MTYAYRDRKDRKGSGGPEVETEAVADSAQ